MALSSAYIATQISMAENGLETSSHQFLVEPLVEHHHHHHHHYHPIIIKKNINRERYKTYENKKVKYN